MVRVRNLPYRSVSNADIKGNGNLIQRQTKNDGIAQTLSCVFITLMSLGASINLAAFEAIITNERSGDVIHISDDGSTIHVTKLCNRPRGMTKGIDNSQVLVACSDDNKVITYNRKTRAIEAEITNVSGAMNLLPQTDRTGYWSRMRARPEHQCMN